jgi:hypothetical protein
MGKNYIKAKAFQKSVFFSQNLLFHFNSTLYSFEYPQDYQNYTTDTKQYSHCSIDLFLNLATTASKKFEITERTENVKDCEITHHTVFSVLLSQNYCFA